MPRGPRVDAESVAHHVWQRGAGRMVVFVDDRDVTAAIRTPEISRGASVVSARPEVRAGLLELQRRLAPQDRRRCDAEDSRSHQSPTRYVAHLSRAGASRPGNS